MQKLIDADKLKNEILYKCDDLDDMGLLDDMRGLHLALDIIERQTPVIALDLADVLKIMDETKDRVVRKAMEEFKVNFNWQVTHEKEIKNG